VRRLLLLATSLVLAGVGAGAGLVQSSAAKAPLAACTIAGTAHISPGLSTASQAFTYTFSGAFSGCKGGDGSVKSGSVSATGSGSGSCAKSKTSGNVTVTWDNGTVSTIPITTTGAGAALKVLGTVSSGPFAGKKAQALLAFEAQPQQCAAAGGVSDPTFNGVGELGE
jgi:hypothetical protein